MENEKINDGRREIYDPRTQPVSYAVVYGFVPEIRSQIIRENYLPIKTFDIPEFPKLRCQNIKINESGVKQK